MQCPRCSARTIIKNGITSSSGKQNYRCKACGRQFVENPTQGCISEEKKRLVNRLLLEKIPLAGIARTVQVSVRWLQYYVNELYAQMPRHATVCPKKKAV